MTKTQHFKTHFSGLTLLRETDQSKRLHASIHIDLIGSTHQERRLDETYLYEPTAFTYAAHISVFDRTLSSIAFHVTNPLPPTVTTTRITSPDSPLNPATIPSKS